MSAPRLLAVAALAAAMLPALPAHAWTLTTLYSFQGGTDGATPLAGLLYQNGTFYGTTAGGGASGSGTVFAINATTGAETVLHSFQSGADGAIPLAGLTHHAGILYGTTRSGGASGFGIVFRLNPKTGTETVLHNFAGGSDGDGPEAGLIYLGGALYGTTAGGGGTGCGLGLGCGTAFKVDATTGAETVLYSFPTSYYGEGPTGLIYQEGFFYGTTEGGGPTTGGIVFKLDATTGAETQLYSFEGAPHDGATPRAGVIYKGGHLYGTTAVGGPSQQGIVFRVNAVTGVERVLHRFTGQQTDGKDPEAGLIYLNGTLYGTTRQGGTKHLGTMFKLDLSTGVETVLHSFTGPDGSGPAAGLIYQGGAFCGTTTGGGSSKACLGGCGTVFKLTS